MIERYPPPPQPADKQLSILHEQLQKETDPVKKEELKKEFVRARRAVSEWMHKTKRLYQGVVPQEWKDECEDGKLYE